MKVKKNNSAAAPMLPAIKSGRLLEFARGYESMVMVCGKGKLTAYVVDPWKCSGSTDRRPQKSRIPLMV
jgi:hypothetical protein